MFRLSGGIGHQLFSFKMNSDISKFYWIPFFSTKLETNYESLSNNHHPPTSTPSGPGSGGPQSEDHIQQAKESIKSVAKGALAKTVSQTLVIILTSERPQGGANSYTKSSISRDCAIAEARGACRE